MRYFTFIFSYPCGITRPMMTGSFYKIKPLHLLRKATKRNLWVQKVVHSECGTSSEVNQEPLEALGILHRTVLRVSRFG